MNIQEGGQEGGYNLKKLTYTHDAMIDLLVQNPSISQGALAAHFGYTEAWISQILNSDNFRERLAQRKDAIVDPVLRMSVEERIKGMIDLSVQVILKKLREAPNAAIAIKALEAGARSIGMGQRSYGPTVQNNFIALVPPTSKSAAEWATQYQPGLVIEHQPATVGGGPVEPTEGGRPVDEDDPLAFLDAK